MGSQTEDLDLDGREALSGIAEVAVALAGFSGLFAAFRRGRGEQFTEGERRALLFMLTASLGAVVLSLVPIPLLLFGISDSIVWLVACLALGIFLTGATLWSTLGAARSAPRFPKLFWPLVSISWSLSVFQFLGVAGLFGLPRSAVFVAGLWWLILAAAIQFLVQVVAATRS